MGRRALVIGAGGGLGSRLTARLLDNGWEVTGSGRRPPEEAVPGLDAYLRVDLAEADAVGRLMAALPHKGFDLVVHNAADYGPRGRDDLELAELEPLFRTNALTPYLFLRELLGALPPGRQCTCVVVNSDAVYGADRTSGAYAASKAALRVLTSALSDSCRGRNVSVCTLLLGPLADPRKVELLRQAAERRGVEEGEMVRTFLRRSNSFYVIDELIDLEACVRSVEYLSELGPAGNGMLCRLDGGSAGSLV